MGGDVIKSAIRPRILTHRGSVAASALCLDPILIGENEARRRVLELWESGAQLSQIGDEWLLRFASPRRFLASQAPGTPLTEREGWLLSAPLSPLEWKEFRAQNSLSGRENVVLVRDGALQIAVVGVEIDPSLWLDVSDWQSPLLEPLGEIAAPKVAAPPLEFEARRALDVPASPELDAFLARLRGETPAKTGKSWADFWGRFGRKRESETLERGAIRGGIARKAPFSLGRLFQFGFGASHQVLPVGAQFSSEFGLVARVALWLAGLALLGSVLSGAKGGAAAILAHFGAWLLLLIPAALAAWFLMSLARLWPVPAGIAAKTHANPIKASPIPFDLLALLFYCGLLVTSLAGRNWSLVIIALIAAVSRAFRSQWQRRRLDTRASAGRNAGQSGAKGRPSKPKRAPSGAWQRFLWQTELGRLVGAYQARYILKMMAMFERGDLDGALRHAVPFSVFGPDATHPSLSLLRARGSLDFLGARRGASGGASGGGLGLPPHIKERMTRLYRDAHEKLAAQNRVDEAAFVLAELLDSPSEAVQFLEKHGRWPVAAQLSEVRELEAGLTVRLWWLAGNRERAVISARRGGAFADAIARLERGDEASQQGARQLRLIWAQSMALAGDFAGAVETAWPLVTRLPPLRGVVGAWIERGLEGQSSGAAQMLARQAHLLPDLSAETLQIWQKRTRDLLDDFDESGVPLRLQFAGLLSAAPPHQLARAAARRTVRALARDAALFPQWSEELKTSANKLLAFAGDSPLRADFAALPWPVAPPALKARPTPLFLKFEAQDAGSRAVFDGVLLPDGRVLVALGESGAQLLSRGGGVAANFAQPCHRLIVSPLGERVLGVAQRGSGFAEGFAEGEKRADFIQTMSLREFEKRAGHANLCRFDLTRQTARAWGELSDLGPFAPIFDGSQWIIGQSDSICALDATAPGPLILWRTAGAGSARRLASEEVSLAMLTDFYERGVRTRTEVWRFDLPSLTLRERRLVPPEIAAGPLFLAPSGLLILVSTPETESDAIVISPVFRDSIGTLQLPRSETVLQIEVWGDHLTVMSRTPTGILVRCHAWHDPNKPLLCQLELEGATRATLRLSATLLCLSDNLGRFIALDLVSGAVRKNLRVR